MYIISNMMTYREHSVPRNDLQWRVSHKVPLIYTHLPPRYAKFSVAVSNIYPRRTPYCACGYIDGVITKLKNGLGSPDIRTCTLSQMEGYYNYVWTDPKY